MKYPQTESILGETMIKYGNDLGSVSNFGELLVVVIRVFRELLTNISP